MDMAQLHNQSHPAVRRQRAVWETFPAQMDRCMAQEMVMPLLFGAMVGWVLLLGQFLYDQMPLMLSRGLPFGEMAWFLLYMMPGVTVLALPVGVALATCLTLTRMGRDNEIMAWRMSGVSLLRLLVPVFLMALVLTYADFLLNDRITPWANHEAMNILRRVSMTRPVAMIDENKFFRASERYFFYVSNVDRERDKLHGVMVYEKDPKTGTYPRAYIAEVAFKQGGKWRLQNGYVHTYDEKGRMLAEGRIKTVTLDIADDISAFWSEQRGPTEMSSAKLKELIHLYSRSGRSVRQWEVDYHFKFSIPFACLVLTLLGAPLSLRFARYGSFGGFLIWILLVFLYQGFLSWIRYLGLVGTISPFLAAWFTNLLFAVVGVVLLWRER
jgi:lipopolysaccharide export system permease protein